MIVPAIILYSQRDLILHPKKAILTCLLLSICWTCWKTHTHCHHMAHSKAQRTHACMSMAKINAGNKENDISSLGSFSDGHSGNSGLSNSALWITCVCVLECKHLLHNTHHKLTCTENTKYKLWTQTLFTMFTIWYPPSSLKDLGQCLRHALMDQKYHYHSGTLAGLALHSLKTGPPVVWQCKKNDQKWN